MQIHAIPVEERSEDSEQQLDVDGHYGGEDHQRHGTHELIHELVGNDCERGGVVEHVVVLVDVPIVIMGRHCGKEKRWLMSIL